MMLTMWSVWHFWAWTQPIVDESGGGEAAVYLGERDAERVGNIRPSSTSG